MAAPAPPDQHTPLRGGDPEGADVSDPDSPQTRLAVPVLGVNDVAWMEKTEAKLETKEEELKADKKKLEAEKDGLVQQRQTFMTHMSVEDDFSLYQLLQSPQVEQWKKDYFVDLNKKLEHVNAQLATARSAYCTVVTMQAQALQKRARESTGATPRATRVRASSPGTPVPTGVLPLHQTSEEHSSQASSAQAWDLYKMFEGYDVTSDYDFDSEDDYIDADEPLIEVRQRCAETPQKRSTQASSQARDVYNSLRVEEFTFDHDFDPMDDCEALEMPADPECGNALEAAVWDCLANAQDLVPVRCRSNPHFVFHAEYTSARGTTCVHGSIPDMLVFRRTHQLPERFTADTCRPYKPLLIEVQSGQKSAPVAKRQLVTTLFSFVNNHVTGYIPCVYGILVEKSLERIHVVRFCDGKFETHNESFSARCLVDICRKVLRGAG